MHAVSSTADMLHNRLRKNARHISKKARRLDITCYRLYDRDIPEIPLAIDWYEGRLHIAEYARRGTPEGDAHGPWLTALVDAAAAALDTSEVFVKHRRRQRGKAQYERFDRQGAVFEVGEGGHRFEVNLSDYLDTGLFLDHRTTRAMFRAEAEGRRVLNLFAYTGAFSVYAAAGGAAGTTTVDLNRTYTEWATRNLALNGFTGPRHEVIRADVDRFLREASPNRWDLAIVDPPTFSNSKMADVFDVQRDHVALLDAVRRVLTPDGVVYFSSNFRKLRYEGPGAEISAKTVPFDFRNRQIHRCWRIGPA